MPLSLLTSTHCTAEFASRVWAASVRGICEVTLFVSLNCEAVVRPPVGPVGAPNPKLSVRVEVTPSAFCSDVTGDNYMLLAPIRNRAILGTIPATSSFQ